MDAAASGARDVFAGRFSVSGHRRADERRFSPSPKFWRDRHMARWKFLARGAADGEVVWSWHPLLMPSLRRRVGPTGFKQAISAGDGGKRNSSPRRARRKPLKPWRGESRVISGVLVVTTLCHLPMHRGCGCNGHPAFPAPSAFYEGQDHAKLGRIAPRECEVVSSCRVG
jgi:hypothetical protein